jgi:hypothetical protein
MFGGGMNNQESKLDETLAAAEQAAKQDKLTSSVRLVIVSLRQIVERQKLLVKNHNNRP